LSHLIQVSTSPHLILQQSIFIDHADCRLRCLSRHFVSLIRTTGLNCSMVKFFTQVSASTIELTTYSMAKTPEGIS